MSGAVLFDYWSHTLLVTAALVVAVLIVRKPFARHFGPRLTYALWLIPALRLVLPPLPFADPVATATVMAPVATNEAMMLIPIDTPSIVGAAPPAAGPPDLTPILFGAWLAGMMVVLAAALASHRRFRRDLLAHSVELESIGSTRLVMSEQISGPVAFGLLRRYVAVPQDFFARYDSEERSLAMDHELSHHRHGDLWANAAALIFLASQWFNPFAWAAMRAFRFDQEAACDARVLTMAGAIEVGLGGECVSRTAQYAAAIAKAAVGSRLILAAPMAAHDNLQERLTMLTKQKISKRRGLFGRMLLCGGAVVALATTATLVPAPLASAAEQMRDVPAPPAPPPPPDVSGAPAPPAPPVAPVAPEAPHAPRAPHDVHQVMVFSTEESDDDQAIDAKNREIRRYEIRRELTDRADGADANAFAFRTKDGEPAHLELLSSLSRTDIMATLKEQGISDKKAAAIADRLEAKRKERGAKALSWSSRDLSREMNWKGKDGVALALATCRDGTKPKAVVDRSEDKNGSVSAIKMVRCDDKDLDFSAQIKGLKQARAQFMLGDAAPNLSAEMRAKVAADFDKAIAEMEKHGK